MLRFLTAGESHGQALVAILEGMPAGLSIDFEAITTQLRRRQEPVTGAAAAWRSNWTARRRSSGIRYGVSTGAPDRPCRSRTRTGRTGSARCTWKRRCREGATGADRPAVTRPRPGHADLAGFVKYGHDDMRNILERASARETVARVAVGAIARQLLQVVGVEIGQSRDRHRLGRRHGSARDWVRRRLGRSPAESPLHCADAGIERAMIAEIDRARDAGDTMGGSFEVIAHAVPPGLGSHVQWDRKLDGRLAQALMSIPAHQGGRHRPRPRGRHPCLGSRVHDEILPGNAKAAVPLRRPTNNAGGLEGGMTNGENLRATGYMKPISTLMKPLRSVDLAHHDRKPGRDRTQRRLARFRTAVSPKRWSRSSLPTPSLEKFGGDSVEEMVANWQAFTKRTAARFQRASQ